MTKLVKRVTIFLAILVAACFVYKYMYGAAAASSHESIGQNLDVVLGDEERKEEEAPVVIWIKRHGEVVRFDEKLIRMSEWLTQQLDFDDRLLKDENGNWKSNDEHNPLDYTIEPVQKRFAFKGRRYVPVKKTGNTEEAVTILSKIKHSLLGIGSTLAPAFFKKSRLGSLSPSQIPLHELHRKLSLALDLTERKARKEPLHLENMSVSELMETAQFGRDFYVEILESEAVAVLARVIEQVFKAHPEFNPGPFPAGISRLNLDLENVIVQKAHFARPIN